MHAEVTVADILFDDTPRFEPNTPATYVLDALLEEGAAAIIEHRGNVLGCIDKTAMRQAAEEGCDFRALCVKELIRPIGVTISHRCDIFEADAVMRRQSVQSLTIVDDNADIIAILTRKQLQFHLDNYPKHTAPEKRLRQDILLEAMRMAKLASWEYDIQTKQTYWSDEIYQITGLDPATDPQMACLEKLVHPDDYPSLKHAIAALIENGIAYNNRYRIIRPDNEERWVNCRANRRSNAQGDPVQLIGVLQDVTEEHKTREALIESESRYRHLVDGSPYPIIIHSEGNIVFVNKATVSIMHARSSEDFIGHPIMQFIHKDDQALVENRIAQNEILLQTEERFIRMDGETIHASVSSSNVQYMGKQAFLVIFQDITEIIKAQNALIQERQRAEQYLDVASVMIIAIDVNGHVEQINSAGCSMLGYPKDEIIGKNWFERFIPTDLRSSVKNNFDGILDGTIDPTKYFENEILTQFGETRMIGWHNALMYDDAGKIRGILSSGEDITARKVYEEKLRLSATVFENSSEGVMITDPNNLIISANRAFTEITGFHEIDVLGKKPSILKSGRHDGHFYQNMWLSLERTGQWRGEIWNRRKNGEVFPQWLNINIVTDKNGHLTHYLGVLTDISKIKASEEKLEFLAHHDPLTGLPNRLLLQARLKHSIDVSRRNGNKVAICFLDLDNFKNINDTYGHTIGDAIIIEVGQRIQNTIREGDTIARIGGDEFVLVFENIVSEFYVLDIITKILALFKSPFLLDNQHCFLTASIGISLFPDDGDSMDTLLKNADAAMYLAKEEGKNRHSFYTEEITRSMFERVMIETDLRRAIDHKQFIVYYQPQIDLSSDNVVGFEALVRWQHPDLGLIMPDRFIQSAEETQLIIPIGELVMHTACKALVGWKQKGYDVRRMAVNVSAIQFEHGDLVDTVTTILNTTNIDPKDLELEITESIIMNAPQRSAETLKRLKALGVTIAIDDFGTGYSSLSILRHLPLDKLKIDRSFVRDLPVDASAGSVAKAVIALAKSLHLNTLAEGIENDAQQRFLHENGCEEGQGYLYSKPMNEKYVSDYLINRSSS